ncbi:molybdopterin-dependent oxidoreductase, partial [Blautia schinkii]|uniref:molybdopterin cofactor-binding domain-containing protein n=1 Tax=Blautia schinkii TaxID=180164 RepID=UPI0023B09A7F
GTDVDKVAFDGSYVFLDEDEEEEKKVSLEQVALKGTFFNNIELQVVNQHSSPLSPPPFMVGMAVVEVDTETGEVYVLDYVAVVDCGSPINPNLARVQTEGGI